jgi:hypothetical protein
MLVWEGVCAAHDAHRFVEWMSTSLAKMFGLWPEEGHDRGGSTATWCCGTLDKEVTLGRDAPHARRLQPLRGQQEGAPPWCSRAARCWSTTGSGRERGPRAVTEAPARPPVVPEPMSANEKHYPDGRVEPSRTDRTRRARSANHDLAPGRRAARLDDLQLRRALDQHGALHPHVHAGLGPMSAG